jgi:hypothetical protein
MKTLIKLLHRARRDAAREVEQISNAIAVLNGAEKKAKPRRTMSAAARKRIGAAQRARWAKLRSKK